MSANYKIQEDLTMALVNQYKPAPAHQTNYMIQGDSCVYYREIRVINIQALNKIFSITLSTLSEMSVSFIRIFYFCYI